MASLSTSASMDNQRSNPVVEFDDKAAPLSSSRTKNAYLELRQQKISRNHSRLRDLGLISGASSAKTTETQVVTTVTKVANDRKRKISTDLCVSATPITQRSAVMGTRRRSQRLQGYHRNQRPRLALNCSSTKPMEQVEARPASEKESTPLKIGSPTVVVVDSQKTFPSNSARSIALNIDKVIDTFLGIPMQATGKAHVMNECGRLSDANGTACTTGISFNKYSGVQEWGNNVFFLWVNLDAPQSTVVNEFSNGTIAWFGGSRMHNGTPVITRLRADNNTVLLWCRKHYTETGFGPYVCLGRLSLKSYDPNSQPLAFKWKLLDYERLVASDESQAVLDEFGFLE